MPAWRRAEKPLFAGQGLLRQAGKKRSRAKEGRGNGKGDTAQAAIFAAGGGETSGLGAKLALETKG